MTLKKYLLLAIIFLFSSTISWAQLKIGDEAPKTVITDWISNVPHSKDLNVKFEDTEKMHYDLFDRYLVYFDDNDLKEYFDMGPVTSQEWTGARLFSGGEVADNQVLLPDDLTESYISYCYKSVVKNTKEDVMDTILHHLNLKYTVVDSLMDVMQLEIVDKDLFNTFISDPEARSSHSSNSDIYATIDNYDFSHLQRTIQIIFQKAVALKDVEGLFNNKISMTVQIDNMENLMASLKTYGIKNTIVKKVMPVYRFEK